MIAFFPGQGNNVNQPVIVLLQIVKLLNLGLSRKVRPCLQHLCRYDRHKNS